MIMAGSSQWYAVGGGVEMKGTFNQQSRASGIGGVIILEDLVELTLMV